jgi:hypothetical protein
MGLKRSYHAPGASRLKGRLQAGLPALQTTAMEVL